jgi:putative ABC transport system substrate-binding protein
MRELGYVDGKDFAIVWRFAEGRYERFPELIAELIRENVDVIVAGTPAAIPAAQHATKTIPIVMAISNDPVGSGYASSIARPGGNTTGLTSSYEQTVSKQLELLASAVSNLSRVGIFANLENSSHPVLQKNAESAAQTAGITVITVNVGKPKELEEAFSLLTSKGAKAFVMLPDGFFNSNRQRIAELALRNHLPSIAAQREYVEAGLLMSYGEQYRDFLLRAAQYVDKIFKGASPGDLPIEGPARFYLVLNRKTARTLGVTFPDRLLALADEVIE